MSGDPNETHYDFGEKYRKQNAVTGRIIDGFFRGTADLVRGLDVARAIEIGCGEGFSTQRLRAALPEGALFEASDVEARLVAAAQANNPGMTIRQESIYELPHDDGAYDLVFVLEVLEHLDEPQRALAEVFRVSRRWVMASVPREPIWRVLNMARGKYWGGLGNTPGHINHWSTRRFRQLVGRYGRVVDLRTPLPWTIVLAERNDPLP